MKKYPAAAETSTVYPGHYTPLPEAAAIMEAAEKESNEYPPKFLVNMSKGKECILIESAIPGCQRSDIYITGYENLLSIFVLHGCKDRSGEKIQLHEINDAASMQRFILLPGNADAEFGSACYRDGILSICIPVSRHPLPQEHFSIMVY